MLSHLQISCYFCFLAQATSTAISIMQNLHALMEPVLLPSKLFTWKISCVTLPLCYPILYRTYVPISPDISSISMNFSRGWTLPVAVLSPFPSSLVGQYSWTCSGCPQLAAIYAMVQMQTTALYSADRWMHY
jgi:hypothetical protein